MPHNRCTLGTLHTTGVDHCETKKEEEKQDPRITPCEGTTITRAQLQQQQLHSNSSSTSAQPTLFPYRTLRMSARHKHANCYLRRGPTAHLRIVKEPAQQRVVYAGTHPGCCTALLLRSLYQQQPPARRSPPAVVTGARSTQGSPGRCSCGLRGRAAGPRGPRDGVVENWAARTRGGAASAGALFTRQQTTTTRTPSALGPTEEGAHHPRP